MHYTHPAINGSAWTDNHKIQKWSSLFQRPFHILLCQNFLSNLALFKHTSHSNFTNVLCNFPKATTEVLPKFLANETNDKCFISL